MIVVGGGAAGMMAAVAATENGHNVVLIEKNEKLGKKIYITGKGRCNVTNACDVETLFQNVVTNPKFLYSAFYGFDNAMLMHALEQVGCKLKIERGERVFPVSDHASDVIYAMERWMKQNNVEVRLNTAVKDLEVSDDLHITGVVLSNGKTEKADAVVLATGGLSYPTTGSDGMGHKIAEKYGHSIKNCVPALVPLCVEEDWCKELQGLSLKNVEVTMMEGKKNLYHGFGEMLFTHFGVSGPLILSASSYYGKRKGKDPVKLTIDLKPALTIEQLDKRVLRDFEEGMNKQFKNILSNLLPSKMIPIIIKLSEIDPDKKVNLISKEERLQLIQLLKHLELTVSGTRGFLEAIITQGGVSVKNINPSTMESKLINGLYLVGELVDLDALTGGFNLQIAWSTGHLAGYSIS